MQNKFDDLWCLLDWAIPGILGTLPEFKEKFGKIIARGQSSLAELEEISAKDDRARALKETVHKYILLTGKEVIADKLTGKIDKVVLCRMSPLQHAAYVRVLKSPDFQIMSRAKEPCDCESGELRGRCCHKYDPAGILWNFYHQNGEPCSEGDGPTCPWCYMMPCMTLLSRIANHLDLLKVDPKSKSEREYIRDMAMAELALGQDAAAVGGLELGKQDFKTASSNTHCGKLGVLDLLLQNFNDEGAKVLIFSQSVKLLDVLVKFMEGKGYLFLQLDGRVKQSERQKMVNEFNNQPSILAFLISTRVGGLGLNLTSANKVVIFDPMWNPSYDLQVYTIPSTP